MIILIGVGIIGILGTIWLTQARVRSVEFPIHKDHEWFRISPEKIEAVIGTRIREHVRAFLKIILIWMLRIYRRVSGKITIKKVLKQKVREFLYEHTPTSIRHPSEFWHKVRHHEKPTGPVITEKITIIEINE